MRITGRSGGEFVWMNSYPSERYETPNAGHGKRLWRGNPPMINWNHKTAGRSDVASNRLCQCKIWCPTRQSQPRKHRNKFTWKFAQIQSHGRRKIATALCFLCGWHALRDFVLFCDVIESLRCLIGFMVNTNSITLSEFGRFAKQYICFEFSFAQRSVNFLGGGVSNYAVLGFNFEIPDIISSRHFTNH